MLQISQIRSLYRALFRRWTNFYVSKLRFAVIWLGQIQNLDTGHVYVLGLKSGSERLSTPLKEREIDIPSLVFICLHPKTLSLTYPDPPLLPADVQTYTDPDETEQFPFIFQKSCPESMTDSGAAHSDTSIQGHRNHLNDPASVFLSTHRWSQHPACQRCFYKPLINCHPPSQQVSVSVFLSFSNVFFVCLFSFSNIFFIIH